MGLGDKMSIIKQQPIPVSLQNENDIHSQAEKSTLVLHAISPCKLIKTTAMNYVRPIIRSFLHLKTILR